MHHVERGRLHAQILAVGSRAENDQAQVGVARGSGLLDSPSRTESGYRIYNEDVLERLDFIKRAQVLGFSLDEIKRIITDKRAGQSPCAEVREIVRNRLADLDARMREMKRYRNELASALAEWDQTGDVPGHVCGLIEGSHIDHDIAGHGQTLRKKKK
jgi:DNA-binding transcriptional MerR regulator